MEKLAETDPSLDARDYDDGVVDDDDNPEWTEADFAAARPARELLGDGFVDDWSAARRDGALTARAAPDAQPRLSAEVIAFYREQGPEWEARLNADLEDLVRIKRRS